MFLFLRMILAHLIGDFLLQFNAVYKAKISGVKGKAIHVLIIGMVMVLFSWPYWNTGKLWVFILLVCVTHFFQDWIKIVLTRKRPHHFYPFVLDQAGHVLILSTVFLFQFHPINIDPNAGNIFLKIYFSNILVLLAIAYILATSVGVFMIGTFKLTAFPERLHTNYLQASVKYYGICERFAMLSLLIFLDARFYALLILFFPLKLLFANREMKKFQTQTISGHIWDTFLGLLLVLILAGLMGGLLSHGT